MPLITRLSSTRSSAHVPWQMRLDPAPLLVTKPKQIASHLPAPKSPSRVGGGSVCPGHDDVSLAECRRKFLKNYGRDDPGRNFIEAERTNHSSGRRLVRV